MITGQIVLYSSIEGTPNGCLECDGTEVSRIVYSRLFNIIGTRWGVGDGSTTFNLPDLRGYFLRGRDAGKGLDPDAATRTTYNSGSVGDNVGSIQQNALQKHKHNDSGHRHTYTRYRVVDGNSGYGVGWVASASVNTNYGYANVGNPVTTGAGTPKCSTESRPTNVYLKLCIKY